MRGARAFLRRDASGDQLIDVLDEIVEDGDDAFICQFHYLRGELRVAAELDAADVLPIREDGPDMRPILRVEQPHAERTCGIYQIAGKAVFSKVLSRVHFKIIRHGVNSFRCRKTTQSFPWAQLKGVGAILGTFSLIPSRPVKIRVRIEVGEYATRPYLLEYRAEVAGDVDASVSGGRWWCQVPFIEIEPPRGTSGRGVVLVLLGRRFVFAWQRDRTELFEPFRSPSLIFRHA